MICHIFVFIMVFAMIVEFTRYYLGQVSPIAPFGVSELLGAHGIAHTGNTVDALAKLAKGRSLPRPCRLLNQGHQTRALTVRGNREPAGLGQGGIYIHELCQTVCTGSRIGLAGYVQNRR